MAEDEGYVEQRRETTDDAVMRWFGGASVFTSFRLLAGGN